MKDNYLDNISTLKGWYRNKFDIVNNYCSILLVDVDESAKNTTMMKILNNFIYAQDNKIPISAIIGDDIEAYCERECGINLPFKYKIKYLFEIFKCWAIVLIIFDGSDLIFKIKEKNFFSIRTDSISFFSTIVLCSAVAYIYRIINLHSLKKKFSSIILKIVLPFIFFSFLIFISMYYPHKYNITMPTWVEVLICLNVIMLSRIIYRKNKDSKLKIMDFAVKQDINDSKKAYVRMLKKGKMNSEFVYIDYKLDKLNRSLKLNKIYLFCPFIFSILPTIILLLYINIVDSLLFFAALFTIELIIFIPIYRGSKKYFIWLIEKYTYFKDNKITLNDWE